MNRSAGNDGAEIHRLELEGESTSEVLIGEDLVQRAAHELEPWLAGRLLFIVSSPRVRELHGQSLDPLRRLARETVELEVPDGEAAKELEVAGRLWREMLRSGGKRDSRLVTLGGGSVGDLGGFVAAAFLRGIEYCQVPTTLLAQVDAAIGGKTAVDLPEGKNTVGFFHHPSRVLADVSTLSTLQREELRAGLVEVVKMAYLLDLELLARVEAELDALLAGEPRALVPVVAASAAAKLGVVASDPKEDGRRRLLNFGHTLGHAIETVLGYSGLRHGEAVGHGLLFALRLAERRGLERPAADRLRRLLARFGLPPLPELEPAALIEAMAKDKKATEGGLVWVLPARLGEGVMVRDVGRAELESELEAFLAQGV